MRVERVEEPRAFGSTWRADGRDRDGPRRTSVEFVLEPTPAGTPLHLVESRFAQLPDDGHPHGSASHHDGWTRELVELVASLGAA